MSDLARRLPKSSGPSLAALIAADLRGRILSGELADRATLPRQSDLLEEFGVSLPTLREALRILESEGLVRVKRGKFGGAEINHPTSSTAAYAIATVLQSNRVRLPDVAVALQEIEPACLAMAARRPDRLTAVIPSLRSLNESSAAALDDREAYRSLVYELHGEFINACGSATMALLATALKELWMSHARALDSDEITRAIRVAHVEAHTRIIDAVEQGQGDLASELSSEHLLEATSHSLAVDIDIDSSSLAPDRTRWAVK